MRLFRVVVVGARRAAAAVQDAGDIAVINVTAVVRVVGLLPKGAARAETDRPCAAVAVVLVLGVFGVGEVVQGVKDVGKDLDVDIARPEEVEVFVVGDLSGDGRRREFAEHGFDVDEGVAAAVDEHDRGLDVAGGILGHFGEARRVAKGQGCVVVVHLEGFGPNDLEPMDHGLGGGERVQVRVGCEFLRHRDIFRFPVEEEADAHINDFDVQGRVDDGLP